MTGACHAPVDGRQGKSGGGQNVHYQRCPPLFFASPVPIEKSADLEMDGREDFQNSLCLWEV